MNLRRGEGREQERWAFAGRCGHDDLQLLVGRLGLKEVAEAAPKKLVLEGLTGPREVRVFDGKQKRMGRS